MVKKVIKFIITTCGLSAAIIYFFPPLARLFMVMCLHHQDLKLEKCFNGMNLLEFLSMEILLIFFTKLSPKFRVNHICKFSPKLPAGTSKKNQAKNKN